MRPTSCLLAVCFALETWMAWGSAVAAGESPGPGRQVAAPTPDAQAAALYRLSGVRGGVVVHVGCGDGRLTAALGAVPGVLVHGLATDPADLERARETIRARGLYGPVSVDRLPADGRLPYIDNFVRLVVVEEPGAVPMAEVMRVLAPNGVACVRQGTEWKVTRKPRPAALDEWTHYLHDPTNNAVSGDTVVGPPRRMQWCGGPRYGRHHDRLSSVTAVVSSGGRVFYIVDEGPRFSILTPPRWRLVARDAASGVVLWKRDIPRWFPHLWPLKSGPSQLPRRLVARGERVYVTLGIEAPVSALDAATGRTLRTYEGTERAEEILVTDDGVLLVSVGPKAMVPQGLRTLRDYGRGYGGTFYDLEPRRLLAIEAETGRVRWERRTPILPVTLAAAGGRVWLHDGESVVCLDLSTGRQRWRSEPLPRTPKLLSFYAPILLVYKDVVMFAGGETAGVQTGSWYRTGKDTMTALDAETGKVLWSAPHPPSGYRSPEDLFVIDDRVWTGETTSGRAEGLFTGRDLHTGEVLVEFTPDVKTYWFHHRCYRGKATVNYLLTSRAGVEFIDFRRRHWEPNHWVRGACLYGVMPAEGLLYAPQHPCACYLESKLAGFSALAPAGEGPRLAGAPPPAERLERGPAFEKVQPTATDPADWPTYRHDAARSGATPSAVAAEVRPVWDRRIGGRLSAPVAAGGLVLVAEVDAHTLHALDAETGRPRWRFTAGGRIDSPPTVVEGRVVFGSADGHVYCLRAADGALAWRFRAAPLDRRCMAFEQLESVWPVHGCVLVRRTDGDRREVWAVAGRSMFLDGGLRLYRLDLATGRPLAETVLDDRVPETGKRLEDYISWLNMPPAMPDVLSCDGRYVYMRSQPFRLDGSRVPPVRMPTSGNADSGAVPPVQKAEFAHLFSPTGLLDDSWWHRTYWMYGSTFVSGWCGYYLAGKTAPAGKILVFDQRRVYGYGRLPKFYRWTTPIEHQLFATPKDRPVAGPAPTQEPTSVVRVDKAPGLDVKGTPLAVEAWVRAESPDGVVVARGGGNMGFALYLKEGRPRFTVRIGGKPYTASARKKAVGRWVHLAGVLTAEGEVRLFVDGSPAGSTRAGGLLPGDPLEGLSIGADDRTAVGEYDDACPLRGTVDEVRLWRRALSAEEIAEGAAHPDRPPKGEGLMAAYSFEGGRARDVSGCGHHGKAVGTRTVAGKLGKALAFAGRGGSQAESPAGQWTRTIPLMPRGLVLAGGTLFLAGPPDLVDEQQAAARLADPQVQEQLAAQVEAFEGRRGALLWAVAAEDGRCLAERRLDVPPVFDGLIAARGRLYLVTLDGRVMCFGPEKEGAK